MREELFEKIASWDKLTTKEKLEAVKWLVSAKIEKVLLQRIAQTIVTKKRDVYFIIDKYYYNEDVDDIETFLSVMWCENPKAEYFHNDDVFWLRIEFIFNNK